MALYLAVTVNDAVAASSMLAYMSKNNHDRQTVIGLGLSGHAHNARLKKHFKIDPMHHDGQQAPQLCRRLHS